MAEATENSPLSESGALFSISQSKMEDCVTLLSKVLMALRMESKFLGQQEGPAWLGS